MMKDIFNGQQNNGNTNKYNLFLADRTYNGVKMKHEGIDFINKKLSPVKTELGGVVIDRYLDINALKGYGVRIKSNLNDLHPELDLYLYHDYYHMFNIWSHRIGDNVKAGEELGKMGNSGNCWYYSEGSWHKISESEIKDPEFQPSTHLHLDFFCVSYPTKLVNKMEVIYGYERDIILEQWGLYFINPILLFDFMDGLL